MKKAPRNKTLSIEADEQAPLLAQTIQLNAAAQVTDLKNQLIYQDLFFKISDCKQILRARI